MAEEIVLGECSREAEQLVTWKQPCVVVEAKMVLSSNSLANPDEEVAALYKMKLYMVNGQYISASCEFVDGKLRYDALSHVANIHEVAEDLEKQAAKWVDENGF